LIAGHFGFAAAVKAKEPSVPLWSLMLACQWLDVVFVPLFAAGVERMEPAVAGAQPNAYGAAIIHADWTHSLVGALALSALFGAVAAWRWGSRSGLVLCGVAFSHWLLDLPMHRGDLPILPGGGGAHLGLGLWRWPMAAAALELVLLLVGAALYWRAARRVAGNDAAMIRRARTSGLALVVAGLLTLGLNLYGL
jgi:membrane-bound metal-dependent hydrolase YbcI (DUF457 family)